MRLTTDAANPEQDMARVHFARRNTGGGRSVLHPNEADQLEDLLAKSRRVAQLVLTGGSIAECVGALPSAVDTSELHDTHVDARRSVEQLARRTFAPVFKDQYWLCQGRRFTPQNI